MALQDRTPRPGLVLEVDKSTPPILFHRGEGFSLEQMPAGRTRVLYPAEPLNPLPDPDGAIRDALLNPLEDDPLPSKLFAGMKLTIVFDDVSLPLPQMRRPDIRQRIIEQVLDMAAEANVDDVHLIAALALHRRMTEDELRHAVGDRVYDAFAPSGLLYNMDAEDPDEMVMLGETSEGEEVQMVRRAAESDLIVYVNINMVSMNGGWKSTATGLSGYKGIRHHHNVDTLLKSSLMDHTDSEFHNKNWRQGDVIKAAGVKVFQVETTINNNVFGMDGPMSVLQKREWEWTARDRASFVAMQRGLQIMPRKARRKVFNSHLAPYGMTSVQGLGYFFNMYRNKPLGRKDGVIIMTHPTPIEFHPVHHPSYIDFFEQVLPDTTDGHKIAHKYEKQFAEDEWYRHLYRTSYAYHGVHPLYMWYWGSNAMNHAARIIIVGGDVKAVRRMGFTPASTMNDALEIASDVVGPQPTITHLHNPPVVMADVI